MELEYCKNSQLTNKSSNEGGSPKKGVEISRLRGGESSDDDSDGDADDNDGGAVSEEEYSDEEEYTMLVGEPYCVLCEYTVHCIHHTLSLPSPHFSSPLLHSLLHSLSLSLSLYTHTHTHTHTHSLEHCVTMYPTLCGHLSVKVFSFVV